MVGDATVGHSGCMRMRARIGTRRWLPSRRLARRTRGSLLGGVWLRCRTWRRRHELDRELARGADPMQSDEMSLRVGQLGSAGMRVRLAHALREAVAVAGGHRASLTTTRLPCWRSRRTKSCSWRWLTAFVTASQWASRGSRSRPSHERPLRSVVPIRSGQLAPAAVLEALEALDHGHRTAGQRRRDREPH